MMHRTCRKCSRELPLSEFYSMKKFNKNGEDVLRRTCRQCYKQICQRYKKGILKWLDDYKSMQKCVKCGYSKETNKGFTTRALEFHHPQNNKEHSISKSASHGVSIEVLKKEIAKCVVVCSRCHAEIHA